MPSRRTQADRTLASRAALVDAAARVLSTRGFARCTTAAICSEAGVTTGTLHHHFATKELLLIAVLDAATDAFLERFKRLRDEEDDQRHIADRLVEAIWPGFCDGKYWAVWEINMGFRSDDTMSGQIASHRRHANDALQAVLLQNEKIAPENRIVIVQHLPFLMTSLRGIFLETFLRDSEFVEKQLKTLIVSLRYLIDAGATVIA
jgi:AcrR family transcriptional regulator